MRPWAFAALIVFACGPATPDDTSPVLALDCTLPFETLTARVLAQQLVAAPKDSAQPYRFYSTPDGRGSYLITDPDAPAHPAVMRQEAGDGQVVTTGCGYGDRAAYDELLKYLDGLKTWRRS